MAYNRYISSSNCSYPAGESWKHWKPKRFRYSGLLLTIALDAAKEVRKLVKEMYTEAHEAVLEGKPLA